MYVMYFAISRFVQMNACQYLGNSSQFVLYDTLGYQIKGFHYIDLQLWFFIRIESTSDAN